VASVLLHAQGWVADRGCCTGLVQHYLFAYLKQANTNMQRLFDMFVRSNAAANQAPAVAYRVCADLAAGRTGFVEAHRKVCGLQDAFYAQYDLVLLLPCSWVQCAQVRLSTGMCVIDASIGFVQHCCWHIQGLCNVDTSTRSLDEHYNHVQPLNVQSCTAS
jgi:hypothetical protein